VKNRIAIIGGGGLGVCTALELANHGYDIHLFEASEALRTKASFANEGKIHIGMVYALDKRLKTAKEMIRGALHFMSYLKRWIELKPEDILSTPFYYLNHTDSLLSKEQLWNHYRSCQKLFQEAVSHFKIRYLDLFDKLDVVQLTDHVGELEHFNPELVESLYKTNEYAVDVRQIATLLRSAAMEHEKISIYLKTKVKHLKSTRKYFELALTHGIEHRTEHFDVVINTSWDGRLELDRQLGIMPPYPWSYRYKLATRVISRFKESDLPSVTIVQGPYGDIVNFKDHGMYYSWYPIGRMGWSEDVKPPAWEEKFKHSKRLDISKKSFLELSKIIPVLNTLHFDDKSIDSVGGVIFALGND
jgi:glycine/D-amino acid oxidase-like deaminating enzyme